jgi:hypothetical protein
VPHDTENLLVPRFLHSEIVGLLAGLGTTFAAVPDLVEMLKRRTIPVIREAQGSLPNCAHWVRLIAREGRGFGSDAEWALASGRVPS